MSRDGSPTPPPRAPRFPPRRPPGPSSRVLLVPVSDASPATKEALGYVAKHLYRANDRVLLLHVVPASSFSRDDRGGAEWHWTEALTTGISAPLGAADEAEPERYAAWLDAAEASLRRQLLPPLLARGVPSDRVDVEVASRSGGASPRAVGEVVADVAADVAAAMVVVAKRGGVSRAAEFVLGSTTNACARLCRCPVVVLNSSPEISGSVRDDDETFFRDAFVDEGADDPALL